MNIKWYMSDVHACGYVRGETLAREVNKQFRHYQIDVKRDLMLSDFYSADVMVFQRQNKPGVLEKVELAKKHGIKTVYDIDDDLFNMPKEFDKPYKFYSQPEVQETIGTFMKTVDAVVCSTEPLAESIKGRCPDTPKFVIENSLDMEQWEGAYAERQRRKRTDAVTIGWMASGSHKVDASLVMPALTRLMDEYENLRLQFIGMIGWDEMPEELLKYKGRIQVAAWVDISELPYAMASFDIGLAPLVQNKFNVSKSGIKAMQYWALGIPVVASPLKPYDIIDYEVDGLLANFEDSWYRGLRDLIEDRERREEMGAAGHAKVLERHDMRNNVGLWIDGFETITSL